uniref:Uncharacterized protein n=1 Tax=Anguilla anguilla TaxID=7936 RepID=A0A0E9TUH1_ANGAN
MPGQIRKIQFF